MLIFLHRRDEKQLKYRIFQHKGVSCRTVCDIRQHALDFDHPIKLEYFELVNKSCKYEIKIVESILIHKLDPIISMIVEVHFQCQYYNEQT